MRLTQKALEGINNPKARRRLMDVFDATEYTVSRYIRSNDDNLTKAAALEVIRQETGLTDSEILETVEVAGKI